MKISALDLQLDIDEIHYLINTLLIELFGEQARIEKHQLDRMKQQLNKRELSCWFFKVEENDKIIGFFSLSESFALYANGFYGTINELWVEHGSRSHGTGTSIIEFIKLFGKDRGWSRIDVTAPPGTLWLRSVNFYEKNGFQDTGIKLKFFLHQN